MSKFKKVESVKAKTLRLKHDNELKAYRDIIKNNPAELKQLWLDIISYDKIAKIDLLKNFVYKKYNYINDVEELAFYKKQILELHNQGKHVEKSMLKKVSSDMHANRPSIDSSKILNDIVKITDEANVFLNKEYTRRNIKMYTKEYDQLTMEVYEKYESQINILKEKLGMLEVEVRNMYCEVEAILSVITLNYHSENSLNQMVLSAKENNLITESEFFLLKSFNTIRNFLVHNSTSSAMLKLGQDNKIIGYKAILIEVNKLILELSLKYKYRLALGVNLLYNDTFDLNKIEITNIIDLFKERDTELNLIKTDVIDIAKKYCKIIYKDKQ